jgi:hypothetical protein
MRCSSPGSSWRPGAETVLATVLHEAAHALANGRGITVTSRGGRYHNRRFAALAEEMGLLAANGVNGLADTTLTALTRQLYASTLTRLAKDLTAYRHGEPGAATGRGAGRPSSNNGLTLACPICSRKIRASIATNAAGPIFCGTCLLAAQGAVLEERMLPFVFTASNGHAPGPATPEWTESVPPAAGISSSRARELVARDVYLDD